MPDPAPTNTPAPTTGDQPAPKPEPAAATTTATTPDLASLPADQLSKVLENPELWKLPRLQELRQQAAEAKKLKDAQAAADDKSLQDQKKFEELAQKRADENAALKSQLEKSTIDQAFTNKLVGENVVDLDAALRLIDRTNVKVDENGQISGLDEALSGLKTSKTYLFQTGTKPVGTPTNPSNGDGQPTGPTKFKRSQITPDFYKAHAAEINEAAMKGLIEDDGPAQQ